MVKDEEEVSDPRKRLSNKEILETYYITIKGNKI